MYTHVYTYVYTYIHVCIYTRIYIYIKLIRNMNLFKNKIFKFQNAYKSTT